MPGSLYDHHVHLHLHLPWGSIGCAPDTLESLSPPGSLCSCFSQSFSIPVSAHTPQPSYSQKTATPTLFCLQSLCYTALLISFLALITSSDDLMWLCRLSAGFPGCAVVKNPPSNAGDTRDAGSLPGWGRSPGGGNGNPL